MKVFVTGGHGFLGKSLCERLRKEGYEVTAPTSKECNLKESGDLANHTEPFDLIFHLAAWTQAGDFCIYHPGEQWINNQKINTNVIEWWLNYQKQAKMIFMGTSCSYAPGAELVEKNYLIGEPIESLYTYALTKRMLLQGALALNKQFGLKWLCLVPSTLYGPGYHTDGRQMHFIFDLIRKIIRAKEFGETVVLWGDGNQKREIVHVDDFINSMLQLVPVVDNDIINLGYGKEFSIRFFAEEICKIIGYDASKIQYDTSRYTGAKSKCLSINKVSEIIPEYEDKLTDMQTGFKTTIDWFYKEKVYFQA